MGKRSIDDMYLCILIVIFTTKYDIKLQWYQDYRAIDSINNGVV